MTNSNAIETLERQIADLNEQIEKANTELKVEASLERVRAVAMSMKKPDDLLSICEVLFAELELLGIKELRNAMVNIYNDDKNTFLNYDFSRSLGQSITVFSMIGTHPVPEYITKQIRQAKSPFAEIALTGAQLADWIGFREMNGELPDPKLKNASILCYYFYSVGTAAIGISTLSSITKQEHEMLKRFSNVFDLAYKRYTDIKQAEAQAREAEIQLALERVRARTMAMRHSDELTEVVKLLYQEFDKLKISNESTDIEIGLIDEETGIASIWAHFYLSDGTISTFKLPLTHIEEINNEFNIWKATPVEKRNEIFLTTVFSGDLSEKFMRMTEDFPELAEIFRPLIEAKITKWVTHNAYFSHGLLTLQGIEAYSSETQEIQKRFAKVFEQTYTRFLDLQKAEAQARGAKIEAALEKVRASSMAMHHSDDLVSVINVVKEQLIQLGFHFHAANFVTDKSDKGYTMWLASPTESFPHKIYVPQIQRDLFRGVVNAIEQGLDFATYTLSFEEKNLYFKYLFENSLIGSTSVEGKKLVFESPGLAASVVLLNKIRLNLMNLDLIPYTDEENLILKRIADVFEQSYIRFLDLQKAEGQAREAEIQLALERVRARTMAMQNGNELSDTAKVLFEQFTSLGYHPDRFAIAVVNEEERVFDYWVTQHGGFFLDTTLKFSIDEPHVMQKMYNAWKTKTRSITLDLQGQSLKEYFQFLAKSNAPVNPDKFVERRIQNVATFSKGILTIISKEPTPQEVIEILERFAQVFDGTYTRFLDLKNAEAQAREAQIETGLERVRSKTMAMHKSEEVTEVAVSLNEELMKLSFEGGSTIIIINRESGDTEQWTGFSEDRTLRSCLVPYFKHPYHDAILDAWKKGERILVHTIAGEEKKTLDEHYFSTGYKIFPENDKKWMRAMEHVTFSHAFMKYGAIHWGPGHLTEEQLRILQRFSKVFEQSYTRFLDLKKAEAQAREAQIEAAVEKVRSRSLAMHKSDELQEVVHTVFERLTELNVDFYTAIIVVFTESSKDIIWWLESKANQQYSKVLVPFTPIKFFNDLFEVRERKADLLSKSYSFDEKNELFNHLFGNTDFKYVPEHQKQFLLGAEFATISVALARNTGIHISSYSKRSFSDQDNQIIKRFANVFDQAYTRFLDLQKAESQAREAEIELALERVRARTMAMQSPTEFAEVINLIGGQFTHLGFDIEWANFGANGLDIAEGIDTWNFAVVPGADPVSSRLFIPRFDHPLFMEAAEQLANYQKTGTDLFVMTYGKEDKDLWLDHLFTKTIFKDVPEEYRAIQYAKPGYTTSNLALKDTFLSIGKFDPISFTEEQHAILRRFGNAFGLAYTRFLDLQKAEAQAREAQIEASLERVRSKTMGMQHSNELQEAAKLLFQQFQGLGTAQWACGFVIWDDDRKAATAWMSSVAGLHPSFKLDSSKDVFVPIYEAAQRGESLFVYEQSGKELQVHYEYMATIPIFKDIIMEDWKNAGIPLPAFQILHCAYFTQGYLMFISFEPIPSYYDIFKRFAKVFEQTYTRFLDLQKAEAQAREAMIETALERVRSRSMGMQKSTELKEVIQIVYEQFVHLNIHVEHAGFIIDYKERDDMNIWLADKREVPSQVTIPYFDSPHWNSFKETKQKGTDFFANHLSFEEKNKFYQDLFKIIPVPDETKEYYFNCPGLAISTILLDNVGLYIENFSGIPYTEEENNTLMRFGRVFQQTYTRFLDLQKAEAQAREAQIEAALERVRSKAMAMQNSTDLNALISHLFEETTRLDFVLDRCIVMIVDPQTLDTTWILSNPETPTEPTSHVVKYHEHKPYLYCLDAWKKRVEKWNYVLEGEEKKKWDQFLFYQTELSKLPNPAKEAMQNFSSVRLNSSFSNFGSIILASFEPLSESQYDILIRFTKVFDLTYTRFNDLKQAEAQAREATIEVALERVRARALAMQEPEELKDVAQVLRNEMGALGVEELETCSIYIHEKDSESAECWYALRDPKETEKKMVADHFHLELNDTWVGKEMKKFYSSNEKQTSIVMQGANRKEWIDYCYKHSQVFSGFYGETIPDRTYHLYKFSHGYIGAAAPGDISAESWRLLSRAASVFSLAYSRFKDLTQARNDLIKLKEEKKRAEDALTELQATQKQLIQSEKMASLGELTAGIAHEIQNPLNFVNNFSDVSNELLEEMKNELEKGNAEEAKAIAIDVKENLDKILHHGKRADAIVKGMLQHSRSNSGQKELTDINTLAEEYIRLAYHGLRAKDKFFNAKFETELDPTLDKINIVPQEIGRVILNLINNSFYAVNEKKKYRGNGYEPIVTISTKKIRDKIEIKVEDNGNGIPDAIKEKIFQPFFTTKPTGQGTGLGLSLSYDIITKGHDGDIKVETKEGEGSKFIISLPVK